MQADGGTRTAAITGAAVAVVDAFDWMVQTGKLTESPVKRRVAAVSVGVVDGVPRIDLDYDLDVRAEVDMNVVMSSEGQFVEVQGTGEHGTFTHDELNQLIALAVSGIKQLDALQQSTLVAPRPSRGLRRRNAWRAASSFSWPPEARENYANCVRC